MGRWSARNPSFSPFRVGGTLVLWCASSCDYLYRSCLFIWKMTSYFLPNRFLYLIIHNIRIPCNLPTRRGLGYWLRARVYTNTSHNKLIYFHANIKYVFPLPTYTCRQFTQICNKFNIWLNMDYAPLSGTYFQGQSIVITVISEIETLIFLCYERSELTARLTYIIRRYVVFSERLKLSTWDCQSAWP